MPFDGAFLHCVLDEINAAKDAHIDKIYQPSREELVFLLRKKGFAKRLLISAKSGMARIQFTENVPENPETPPMFCMLLRKHFQGARFTGAEMQGLERVAQLCFNGTNELGDRVNLKIICEFTGTANIILLGNDGRILDAVHRSGIETEKRITAPGAVYEFPQKPPKLNMLNNDTSFLSNSISKKGGAVSTAVLEKLEGVSPLIARELAFLSYGDDTVFTEKTDILPLEKRIDALKSEILSGGTPYIYYEGENTPKEFCYTEIKQYGGTLKAEKAESYSALLDRFYAEREKANLKKRVGGDVSRLLKNLTARVSKRKNNRIKELEATRDRENLRIYGELLKANISVLKSGVNTVRVQNFYDSNMEHVDIPVDPSISIQANAAKYFKEYKKSYNAEQSLIALIEKDTQEEDYLFSVTEALERAETVAEINEIREELCSYGYIKSAKKQGAKRLKAPKLCTYESDEGYKIIVGKNNTQNDYITTVLASKNDTWFHTKNIHGAHVVVFNGGAPLSDKTVLYAARLAAENSKAAKSSNVPVDYTAIKYVKKPSGARAGMVIYTTNKTIFVTPER